MSVLIFEKISSALMVRSICTALGPDIPTGSVHDGLIDMHCDPTLDPLSNPSRVIGSDGCVGGIARFENYWRLEHADAQTIDKVMEQLEPNKIVSSALKTVSKLLFISMQARV